MSTIGQQREVCDVCGYYRPLDTGGGLCCRHAPEPLTQAAAVTEPAPKGVEPPPAYWPKVGAKDWCGDFESLTALLRDERLHLIQVPPEPPPDPKLRRRK